jgi:membrane protease subunit (stomatin/prohibitin family)
MAAVVLVPGHEGKTSEDSEKAKLQTMDMSGDMMMTRQAAPVSKYDKLEVGTTSCITRACPGPLSCCLSAFLPVWFGGCQTVNENEAAVNLTWGKLSSVITEPGIYCMNPCGLQTFKQSMKQVSLDLKKVKVIDKKGNPLLLSAIVVYRVVDPVKASLEVQNVRQYIASMGEAVLKQIAALYPYESHKNEPSLKTEAQHIAQRMIRKLQTKVSSCGASILDFALTDLSYAPEIAQAMLVRQQAEALIDARTMIVQGAVDIAYDAAKQLNDRGVTMDNHEKSRMVSNLMCIICGDANVQPTLSV